VNREKTGCLYEWFDIKQGLEVFQEITVSVILFFGNGSTWA